MHPRSPCRSAPTRDPSARRFTGTQTAVVVGPSGDEISTDKYGRVKVQFPWDREGKKNLDSSCWVRVATSLGRQAVGHDPHSPRRPGSDRRLRGRRPRPADHRRQRLQRRADAPLQAPRQQDPERLQDAQHHRAARADNFNELRFEDKKDSEEVYFHAEKDFNRVVENNDTLKVGFDKKDKGDQTVEIYNNQSVTIGKLGASDGSETRTIYKNRTTTIQTGNEVLEVQQGNRTVTLTMGNDALNIDQGNRTITLKMGDQTTHLQLGNQSTKLDLGASSTEAMQSIELKVGESSVKLDQFGVTIKGMMVKIEGEIQTTVTGLMTQVKGDAMLQAKGAITMIG